MNIIIILLFATLRLGTPLIFAGLGGLISEKSGVTNIGLEGMMTMGAFFGVLGSYLTGNAWAGVLMGTLAGGAIAVIHAVMCIKLRAQQVISGTAINLFSSAITSFMIYKVFQKGGQTDLVTSLAFGPAQWWGGRSGIFGLLKEMNWFIILALLAVAVVHWVLNESVLGLRILSVGEHPKAADTLGVNVNRLRYGCVIVSGLLAGMGGVALSLGATPLFIEGMVAGRGFIALAAVVFGRWKPLNTMAACLIFGFAEAIQIVAQGFGFSLPAEVYSSIPYIMSLVAMIFFAGRAKAPKACGDAYVRENDK